MNFIKRLFKKIFPEKTYTIEIKEESETKWVLETPLINFMDAMYSASIISGQLKKKNILSLPSGFVVKKIPTKIIEVNKVSTSDTKGEGVGFCQGCHTKRKLVNCLCTNCGSNKWDKEEKVNNGENNE